MCMYSMCQKYSLLVISMAVYSQLPWVCGTVRWIVLSKQILKFYSPPPPATDQEWSNVVKTWILKDTVVLRSEPWMKSSSLVAWTSESRLQTAQHCPQIPGVGTRLWRRHIQQPGWLLKAPWGRHRDQCLLILILTLPSTTGGHLFNWGTNELKEQFDLSMWYSNPKKSSEDRQSATFLIIVPFLKISSNDLKMSWMHRKDLLVLSFFSAQDKV